MLDTVGSTADGVSGHCVAESPIPGSSKGTIKAYVTWKALAKADISYANIFCHGLGVRHL